MRLILLSLVVFSFSIISCKSPKNEASKNEEVRKEEKKIESDTDLVKGVLSRYKDYTMSEDLEGIISLVSPSLLEKNSKNDLVKELREGMHNESYDLSIEQIYYDSISRIVKRNGNKYASAKTRTEGLFKLKNQHLFDNMCRDFKRKYEKVKCTETELKVSLEMKGEVYIIYSEKEKKWFILSDTDPQSVEELIPADIRNELNIIIHPDGGV